MNHAERITKFESMVASGHLEEAGRFVANTAGQVGSECVRHEDLAKLQQWLQLGQWACDTARLNAELAEAQRDLDRLPPELRAKAGVTIVEVDEAESKPPVKMFAVDHEGSNAFAILGRCRRAARQAGWSNERIDAFTKAATSGDYDKLLATVMQHFDCDRKEEEV